MTGAQPIWEITMESAEITKNFIAKNKEVSFDQIARHLRKQGIGYDLDSAYDSAFADTESLVAAGKIVVSKTEKLAHGLTKEYFTLK